MAAFSRERACSIIERVQAQYNGGQDLLTFAMSCAVLLRIARCQYLYQAEFLNVSDNHNTRITGNTNLDAVQQDAVAFSSLVQGRLVPLFQHLLRQLGRDEREATSATCTTNGVMQLLERAKVACQRQLPIEIPDVEDFDVVGRSVSRDDKGKHSSPEFTRSQPFFRFGGRKEEKGHLEVSENESLAREPQSWDDLARELRDANNLADGLLVGTPTSSLKHAQ
jgi:hypothetical protein